MKSIRSALFLIAALIGATASLPALSQSSGQIYAVTPMTRDNGAILTFAATQSGTVNSADQNGFNASRITCLYNQTTAVGAPSTTISVQNKDAASGTYYTIWTNPTLTATPTTTQIFAVGTGVTTTASAVHWPLARNWRIRVVGAGTGTSSITGTIGCSVQ